MKVELKWRCWKRRKAPLLTDAQRKHGCYSRGSIDIGNSKTGVMFYLVTNRRIKFSMFHTHPMTPFGVRKKKMFLSPRRSSLVRLFLCGEVGPVTATGLTRLHFVPQHTSINSEYYINNILKKELKTGLRETGHFWNDLETSSLH